jgi:hypothetical protein
MPVRGLPLQFLNPERKIPKTVGEWYQLCFYNNLDDALRAGRAMTYGSIGGKLISIAEGYRIVARAGRRMASALQSYNFGPRARIAGHRDFEPCFLCYCGHRPCHDLRRFCTTAGQSLVA